MTDAAERAREIAERHGLVCLVPSKPEGVTSHEHTLCDCKVIAMLSAALREAENAAYEKAAQVADETGSALGESAVGHCIATAIRALQDKGE